MLGWDWQLDKYAKSGKKSTKKHTKSGKNFVSTLMGRHNLLPRSFIWLKIKREGKENKIFNRKGICN